MPRIEDTKWDPPINAHGRLASESVKLLRSIQVGDVKRIFHEDVKCKHEEKGGYSCSLNREIFRLKGKGLKYKSYDEKEHIIIVSRIK